MPSTIDKRRLIRLRPVPDRHLETLRKFQSEEEFVEAAAKMGWNEEQDRPFLHAVYAKLQEQSADLDRNSLAVRTAANILTRDLTKSNWPNAHKMDLVTSVIPSNSMESGYFLYPMEDAERDFNDRIREEAIAYDQKYVHNYNNPFRQPLPGVEPGELAGYRDNYEEGPLTRFNYATLTDEEKLQKAETIFSEARKAWTAPEDAGMLDALRQACVNKDGTIDEKILLATDRLNKPMPEDAQERAEHKNRILDSIRAELINHAVRYMGNTSTQQRATIQMIEDYKSGKLVERAKDAAHSTERERSAGNQAASAPRTVRSHGSVNMLSFDGLQQKVNGRTSQRTQRPSQNSADKLLVDRDTLVFLTHLRQESARARGTFRDSSQYNDYMQALTECISLANAGVSGNRIDPQTREHLNPQEYNKRFREAVKTVQTCAEAYEKYKMQDHYYDGKPEPGKEPLNSKDRGKMIVMEKVLNSQLLNKVNPVRKVGHGISM